MQKISKEELLKIAHLSRLQLDEQEVTSLIRQIDDVLTYASRVKDIAALATEKRVQSHKNQDVFREDIVAVTDIEPILNQAPSCEQNYFVVPAILETT